MPLSVGDRLGPYEVLEPIGAGGMGEVYRARDTRLGRDVAIKVSAERFSDRFEREARAVAALNHPNICHLYDVGPNYLVMELVEGESPKGPLPLEEALRIARQIGDALEAAHEKGIIHRDLKPANIKITPDGAVKVLDFGLAKTTNAASGAASPEDSPTISMAATQAGVILGTAAYMSPEQARGKVVDKRADIWAFGVVLYELLTGKRLFVGEDLTETLASVVKQETRLDDAPPQVRRLLRGCLEKDPKKRLRDIGDAWRLLEEAPSPVPSRTKIARRAGGLAAGVLAIAGVLLWAPWRPSPPADRSLVRLDVDLGPEISLAPLGSGTRSSVILSPDGTRLVYAASISGGPQKLFIRGLDQPNAVELPGTEGVNFPFFSPDGQWVGFGTGAGKLNKISVEGGAVVPLCDITFFSASWGEDGNIVIGEIAGNPLVRIPSSGGAATPLTELASGEASHGYPQILPGGKAVLFTAYMGGPDVDKAFIDAFSLAGRRRKTLVRGGTSAHYVSGPDGVGYLVYTKKATLFAIAFDLERLETRGTAVPVLDGIAFEPLGNAAHYGISRNGTLVYRKAGGAAAKRFTVRWLDAAGELEPLVTKPGNYRDPHLSPDGKRLALAIGDAANADIWIYDRQRDAWTRLTSGGWYGNPIWSPDGLYIVFGSFSGMLWTRADGAGQPQALTHGRNNQIPVSFSPDGKRLGYTERESGSTSWQIWTVPVEESGGQLRAGMPEQFLHTQFSDAGPFFSPDGRWLAYQSDESGHDEVYVRAFPAPGQAGKWLISNSGGESPMWSPKEHELLYQSGDQIMTVKYTASGDSFLPEKPRVWLSKLGGSKDFDLAPDGKHLVVVMPAEDTPEAPKAEHEVTFLFNFIDYLRRRVPAGK